MDSPTDTGDSLQTKDVLKANEPSTKEKPIVENVESVVEEPKDPEAGKTDVVIDDYYTINPFFYEVASYFGVEQKDFDIAAPKLSVIVDWIVNQFSTKDPGEILLKLSELENSLQKPMWDEKRYTNLYKYVRLSNQRSSIEKAMKAFERKNNNG
jgi:hypothetical protein